ncbi:MAG: hypothetical protein WD278_09755 [Pirellulales bacterium]
MFYGLKRLKQVEFQHSPISREGLAGLREALPNLQIVHELAKPKVPRRQPVAANNPELKFLSWQHQPPEDPQAPIEGIYWRPDGNIIEDPELLTPLRLHRWPTPPSAPGGPRYLHLFVSHPRLGSPPYGQIQILEVNGRTIDDTLRPTPPLSTISFGVGALSHWQYFQVYIAERVKLPRKALVRLKYTTGDWQRLGTIHLGSKPGDRPAAGTTIVSVGEAVDGASHVSLYIDEPTSGKFEFRVLAMGPEEQQRRDWGQGTVAIAPPGLPNVFTFKFSQPLSALDGFELLGREIQVTEFDGVVLR